MKIGDKLSRIPSAHVYEHEKHPRALPCQVVYIHPERRFYTVEFRFPATGWAFREAYFFPERLGDQYPSERRMKHEKNCNYEQ